MKYQIVINEIDDNGNTKPAHTSVTIEADEKPRYECIAEGISRIMRIETRRMITQEFSNCVLSKQDYDKLYENINKRLIGVMNEQAS